MSLRRVGGLAAVALAGVLWLSCGEVYRPVVIPTTLTPPTPANFHEVFGIAANAPFNFGAALQIDVSGDSEIGAANMGVNPTHAAILPSNSRVFVASAGASLCGGDTDLVTSFTPAADSRAATGLGTPITFSFPNIGGSQSSADITAISEAGNLVTVALTAPLSNAGVGGSLTISGVVIPGVSGTNPGYNGCFQIVAVNGTTVQYANPTAGLNAGSGGTATVPTFCPYLPDFVATTQNTAVYVASYGTEGYPNCSLPGNLGGTDSVALLNTATNAITNIAYLYPQSSSPAPHPVAMVETPNALNLYVLNQGTNTVLDLSPIDLSTLTTIPVGNTPAWATVRPDGQRLYVITQGDGQLYTIRTDTNAIVSNQSVGGPGANFVLYDKSRNRLYVTNPNAGAVYVFSATTDPPTLMATLAIPAPPISASATNCATYTCAYSSVMPVSVAALPDGTRFYVSSYVTGTATLTGSPATCPDLTVTAPGCVIPQVTVYDAATFAVRTTVFPLLSPTVISPTPGFAVAPSAFCAPVVPYTPANARFRMSAVAAVDSSRVYTSMCDGGWVAIVNTTASAISSGTNNSSDVLVSDLPAPFSAAAPVNGVPPLQNPLFLLTGQ